MMRANVWHGKNDVRIDEKADPTIVDPHDAIVKVTLAAICGSDLHLYDGVVPTMEKGDILGHEFMGEIVAVGSAVHNIAVGDRVVVAFPIACGECFFCRRGLFSGCERSNQNKELAEKMWGHSPAGVYGYSHAFGGYAGGQSEYVRVPFADTDCLVIPDELDDEQVLFLSDIFPTGYMAAENCDIRAGDTIAIWGCGPVGQFAIRCAFMLDAGRVIAIDNVPERLAMARAGGAETIDYTQVDNMNDALKEMTAGRGPDACIDAVGMEAHSQHPVEGTVGRVKQAVKLETDRPFVLRDIMMSCRNGGTLSVPGAYVGFVDTLPFGSVMNRGLTLRTAQCPVQKYWGGLLRRIRQGEIDPSFVITHRIGLDQTPAGYKMFRDKEDGCIKVVLQP
jgi:threonine dehydrogenase-like Zn-dependent dehydrogenase